MLTVSSSTAPLLLPSIFPSISVFSSESTLHIRWSKYWSFSTSPSNEYSGLISLWIYWFDLPAVQGMLKSLLQHHNLKASILWHSAFFLVQLSHLYITTGKTIALPCTTAVFPWWLHWNVANPFPWRQVDWVLSSGLVTVKTNSYVAGF